MAPCLLGMFDGAIAVVDGTFDVAKLHIHPACAFDFGHRSAAFGFDAGMRMPEVNEPAEAADPVALNHGTDRACARRYLSSAYQRRKLANATA